MDTGKTFFVYHCKHDFLSLLSLFNTHTQSHSHTHTHTHLLSITLYRAHKNITRIEVTQLFTQRYTSSKLLTRLRDTYILWHRTRHCKECLCVVHSSSPAASLGVKVLVERHSKLTRTHVGFLDLVLCGVCLEPCY